MSSSTKISRASFAGRFILSSMIGLLGLAQTGPTLAADKIEIAGNVLCEDKPAKNIHVRLQCEINGNTESFRVKTAADGSFAFTIDGSIQNCKVIVKNTQSRLSGKEPCDPSIVSGEKSIIEINYLRPGSRITDVDFCFKTPGVPDTRKITIGDQIFCDNDGDGKFDPRTDEALADIKVMLDCALSDGTTNWLETTTDDNGRYEFMFEVGKDVTANCLVIVNNWQPALEGKEPCEGIIVKDKNSIFPVNGLRAGDEFLDADFCFRFPPTGKIRIGDMVFCDVNNNGKFDAGKDKPIEDVKVKLVCDLSDGTTLELSTRTDKSGFYFFMFDIDLRLTADCVVKVKNTQGALEGKEPCDPEIVKGKKSRIKVKDLRAGDIFKDADFCFRIPDRKKVTIGDLVFCDLNDNGKFDRNDAPIEDVKVRLACNLSDGTSIKQSTRTDENGLYAFMFDLATRVTADCKVRVKNTQRTLEGKEPCDPAIVKGKKSIIDVNDLEGGDEFLDADFCFRFPPPVKITIGDMVFCDNNGNLKFDAGIDEPLGGVTVDVICLLSNGETRTATTTTDFNGIYRIMFDLPSDAVADACDVMVNTTQAALADCNIPCCPELDGGSSACEKGRKLTALTFEYTGEGCGASNNDQGKKSECSTGAVGVEPVTITVAGKKNGGKTFSNVSIGDRITILASDVDSKGKFPSEIRIEISSGENNVLHTSCSAPLAVGDQFGSLLLSALFLEGDQITTGGDSPICERADVQADTYIVSLGPIEAGGQDLNADFCFRRDETACEKGLKPAEITFRYTGEGCVASNNIQGKKSECTGDAGDARPVTIRVSKKSGKNGGSTFTNTSIGDLITITAADVNGKDKFPSEITIEILDGGSVVETNRLHTSCSAPLAVGDQFGSMLVTRLILTGKAKKSSAAPVDVPEIEAEVEIPGEFSLLQNYPNPFNPETEIRFQLPETSEVVVKIYNALGQEVLTLVRGAMKAGFHSITWNGKDQNGKTVASGTYLMKFSAGDFTQVRKMTLLR